MKVYAVLRMHKSITATYLLGREKEIPLDFDEGMAGALFVYSTREDAEKQAHGSEVIELEEVAQ